MQRIIWRVLLAILLLASNASARVLRVPADFPAIQGAIDAASDGDIVRVFPGTYHEHEIDFKGKAITVTGTAPEDSAVVAATVVDGDSLGTVFHFRTGEDTTSVLCGITITEGNGSDRVRWLGGGVTCTLGASPKIIWCIISNNNSDDAGGIMCDESSPIIKNCVIESNVSNQYNGGGVYLVLSSARLLDCTIRQNNAMDLAGGGGLYIDASPEASIIRCRIMQNTGWDAVRLTDTDLEMHYCQIEDNECIGISCSGSDPFINGCTISGNYMREPNASGAGVFCVDSNPFFQNSIISKNVCDYRGGGVYSWLSRPIFQNCNIIGNISDTGGGIYNGGNPPAVITNSIVTQNHPDQFDYSFAGVVTYSNIEGGWPGEGNIDANPLFVNPITGDFHLLAGSPCVDVGTLDGAPSEDFEGDHRPWGDAVDIGVDEFDIPTGLLQGTVRDVDTGAPVKNVRLEILQGYTRKAFTVTDVTGSFSLAIEAGNYDIHTQIAGYLQTGAMVTIVAGETTVQDLVINNWEGITHCDVPGFGDGTVANITVHLRVEEEGDYKLQIGRLNTDVHCMVGRDNPVTITARASGSGYTQSVVITLRQGLVVKDREVLRVPVDLFSSFTRSQDRELAHRYAPVLRLGADETYHTKGVTPTLLACDLMVKDSDAWVVPFAGPANDELLGTHFFRAGNLGIATNDYASYYEANIANTPSIVYARVVEENGRNFVFYWFHYFYNNWNEHEGFNFHEGDWECVAVELDATGKAIQMGYSQHFKLLYYGGGNRVPWRQVEKEMTHPIGYVAEGSHATYPHAGITDVPGYGRDFHEGDGIELLPFSLYEVEPQTEPYTLVILPRLDETWEDRDPNMEWVRYFGEWGEHTGDWGFNGATAPVKTDRWFEPSKWMDDLDGAQAARPPAPRGQLELLGFK